VATQSWLEVERLSLRFGGALIIDDVSLSVPEGEMLGIIGPNGAGKTTLLNLISGIYRPSAGRILMEGRDISTETVDARARAGLGRSFQTSNLFGGLSVLENVRLAAQSALGASVTPFRRPTPRDPATETARQRLAEVGLEGELDTLAGSLSHGDKRKLEVAMLLAGNPSVILLDEPMAGVGSGDVPGLVDLIGRVHRGLGRTVLMVEHHLEVVLGLVDRVAVMHHGKLLACDTPEAIMANPTVQTAYLGEPV
jgi:branched-chain amino acid transport system ATP-binding protein